MKQCPICSENINCVYTGLLVELDGYLRVGDLYWCWSCQTFHLFGVPAGRMAKNEKTPTPVITAYANMYPENERYQVVVGLTVEGLTLEDPR